MRGLSRAMQTLEKRVLQPARDSDPPSNEL